MPSSRFVFFFHAKILHTFLTKSYSDVHSVAKLQALQKFPTITITFALVASIIFSAYWTNLNADLIFSYTCEYYNRQWSVCFRSIMTVAWKAKGNLSVIVPPCTVRDSCSRTGLVTLHFRFVFSRFASVENKRDRSLDVTQSLSKCRITLKRQNQFAIVVNVNIFLFFLYNKSCK